MFWGMPDIPDIFGGKKYIDAGSKPTNQEINESNPRDTPCLSTS